MDEADASESIATRVIASEGGMRAAGRLWSSSLNLWGWASVRHRDLSRHSFDYSLGVASPCSRLFLLSRSSQGGALFATLAPAQHPSDIVVDLDRPVIDMLFPQWARPLVANCASTDLVLPRGDDESSAVVLSDRGAGATALRRIGCLLCLVAFLPLHATFAQQACTSASTVDTVTGFISKDRSWVSRDFTANSTFVTKKPSGRTEPGEQISIA